MKYLKTKSVELISEWNTKECLKIVVSFLNTNNGVIYVGINNNGYVCGINNLKNTLRNIKDSLNNKILPSTESLCKVTTESVDNKHIIVINIKKGNKLYYIKKYGRSSLGCFYRDNTFCLTMSENEIEKRFAASIDRIQLKDISTIHSDLSFKAMKLLLLSNKKPINENDFLIHIIY